MAKDAFNCRLVT